MPIYSAPRGRFRPEYLLLDSRPCQGVYNKLSSLNHHLPLYVKISFLFRNRVPHWSGSTSTYFSSILLILTSSMSPSFSCSSSSPTSLAWSVTLFGNRCKCGLNTSLNEPSTVWRGCVYAQHRRSSCRRFVGPTLSFLVIFVSNRTKESAVK